MTIHINHKKRCSANNVDELFKKLSFDERKEIVSHAAVLMTDDLIKSSDKIKQNNSFVTDLNGINVTCISNGYEIICLDFAL